MRLACCRGPRVGESGFWALVRGDVSHSREAKSCHFDPRFRRAATRWPCFALCSPVRPGTADDETSAEPVALPPVLVTTPTRLPTPESEVGSSITVIPSEEIERKQERMLPDALQDVPGLNVVQTGGPGGTTSVFIRGANSNQTKVFIDGIDATDPATGTFNFGRS